MYMWLYLVIWLLYLVVVLIFNWIVFDLTLIHLPISTHLSQLKSLYNELTN